MNPILGNLRRLAIYLLAWLPLALLVAYLLKDVGGLGFGAAAALGIPLGMLYALMCLPSWYLCRLTPLGLRTAQSILVTHLAAGLVLSAVWVAFARSLSVVLSRLKLFPGIDLHVVRAGVLLFGFGVLMYLLAVAMNYILLAVEASRRAEEREVKAQILARDAELRALKAQVNPHFLYNSLHSISALTSLDPARAREMCILLGEFLRRTLGLGEKTSISLADEVALVGAYLRVEKVRFGARLEMTENLDAEAMDAAVPPLILQPMVENAVVHGISNLPEGGWIRLGIRRLGEQVEIVVENRFDAEMPPARRHGLGLANIRQRLEASYGGRASLQVSNHDDCFEVRMALPFEPAPAAN